MTRRVSALAVASIAAVLLVVVVAADVAINRSYRLETQDLDDRWHVALDTLDQDRFYREPGALEVNQSVPVPMRLSVDNQRPWSLEQTYEVRLNGAIVSDGTLTASAWGTGQATFEVDAGILLTEPGSPDRPVKVGFAQFEVTVGDEVHHGSLSVREVAR